jgi:trigger factor
LTSELILVSSCIRELKIFLTKEEFDDVYNQELRNIQKKIKMPGFRPGKVPIKLIQSQYGASIKIEAQENTAEKYFKDYIRDNNITVLGTPAFTDLKENEDSSQIYIIKFETLPDFELKDYKSLEIYEPSHKVSDEEIDDEINHRARELSEREEVEIVTDYNHCVTVDGYSLIDAEDEKGGMPHFGEILFYLSDGKEFISKVRELFLNKKVGEEVKYFPNKEEKDSWEGPKRFVIKKVEKIIPCEINDEFAKLASHDKFDNLDDYKQEIGFDLQKEWDEKSRQLMEEQIISKIMELHNDLELPTVLVAEVRTQVINSYKQQNPYFDENKEGNKEYLDKIAQRIAKMELVQDRIIKKEKLEVEDYDYENFVDDFLSKHSEYGQSFSRDVLLTQVKTNENLKGNLLKKKFVDLLLDFTKTNEIDYDEYINLHNHTHSKDCDCGEDFLL